MPAPITSPFASIHRRRRSAWAWLAALACATLLAACAGGSGSSGFDVITENAAIDTALATNECTVNDGLTICPSGPETPTAVPSSTATPSAAPATRTATLALPTSTMTGVPSENTRKPTNTPIIGKTASPTPTIPLPSTASRTATSPQTETPTATPVPTPQVRTDQSPGAIAPCSASDLSAPCLFEFTFEPQGFSGSTTYAVGYRTRNPDSDWQIVMPVGYTATIPLMPGAQYQFAVLVFVTSEGRGAPVVDALAQTDANFAFVTPVLTAEEVEAQPPPLAP
jgi:hypothetical protein